MSDDTMLNAINHSRLKFLVAVFAVLTAITSAMLPNTQASYELKGTAPVAHVDPNAVPEMFAIAFAIAAFGAAVGHAEWGGDGQ